MTRERVLIGVVSFHLLATALGGIAAIWSPGLSGYFARILLVGETLLVALAAFSPTSSDAGQDRSMRAALLWGLVAITVLSAASGLLSGQEVPDVGVGVVRGGFWIMTVIVVLSSDKSTLLQGLETYYFKLAIIAYSALAVSLAVTWIVSGPVLLPIGAGFDPILLAIGFGGHRRHLRFQAVMVMVAFLSLKRIAMIAVVMAMVLGAFIPFGSGLRGVESPSRIRTIGSAILLSTVIVLGVFAQPALRARTTSLLDAIQGSGGASVTARLDETQIALESFEDLRGIDVVIGAGAGHQFQKFSGESGAIHNTYVSGMVTSGPIWLVTLFACAGLAMWRARRNWISLGLILLLTAMATGNGMMHPQVGILIGLGLRQSSATRDDIDSQQVLTHLRGTRAPT